MRLIYVYQPGCPICKKTKPAVMELARRHPEVRVSLIDSTLETWPERGVEEPKTYPSFVALEPGREPRTLEGQTVLDILNRAPRVEDLERWLFQGH